MQARGNGDTRVPGWLDMLAGAGSAALARTAVAPLDVVKIRLQAEPRQTSSASATQPHNTHALARGSVAGLVASGGGMRHVMTSLWREDGLVAFWRGNAAALVLWMTYGGVQFPLYHALKRRIESVAHPNLPIDLTAVASTIAGGAAGATATAVTFPLDWLRTRFAFQGVPRMHTSLASMFVSEWRAHGPRVFFQGFWPTLAAIAPQVGITFLMYEKSSLAFDVVWTHAGATLLPQHDASTPEDIFSAQAQLRSAFAGAVGGTVGKLAVYPLDTVKKRLQVGGMQRAERYARTRVYNGALHALTSIAREEGIVHGLYRGTLPSLAKASAAASLSFWSYELVMRTLVKIVPSSVLHPGAPDEGDV